MGKAITRPITELELRQNIRRRLLERVIPGKVQLFEELQIERGAARVDLALVGDQLEAFELKSDRDDFTRLHNQIHAYNRVFDRITIVTGSAYAQAVQEVVPSWWGLMAVERLLDLGLKAEGLKLRIVRPALPNPAQDRRSLAMLLWREAAALVLREESSVVVPSRANRYDLERAIAESVELARLREHVCRHLLERKQLTAPTQSRLNGDSSRLDASCLDFHCLT
jgi:hypothetical protein